MLRVVSIASAFTLALLFGTQAIAQQPPANAPSGGTPDAMPFDIPYGMAITTEKAKQILAAAEAEAKKAQLENEHRCRRHEWRPHQFPTHGWRPGRIGKHLAGKGAHRGALPSPDASFL